MADWADDPAVREAMDPAREISAILALPEELARGGLAVRGLYPVSVAHGELDSDKAVELISSRMAETAERLGCRHMSGGNDATTYLFPVPRRSGAVPGRGDGVRRVVVDGHRNRQARVQPRYRLVSRPR